MKLIALALLAAGAAHADVVGVADMQGGGQILLYEEAGPCVGQARKVEYKEPGKPTIPGCWLIRGPLVAMVFFDGDLGSIPAQSIKKPTSL